MISDKVNTESSMLPIEGKHVSEFHEGDKVRVYYSIGSESFDSEFTVKSVNIIYINSEGVYETRITVEEALDENYTYNTIVSTAVSTDDGQIGWEIVDNINKITYDWNSYVTFKYELEILGD